MRIIIPIIASLAICASALTNTTSSTNSTTTRNPDKIAKKSSKETREKRTLDQFGNYGESPFSSNLFQISLPTSNRRISTGRNSEPRAYFTTKYAPSNTYNNVPSYSVQLDQLAQYRDPNYSVLSRDYELQENKLSNEIVYTRPQYIEAPEPIIEIIIKESNETLPAIPQALPLKQPKEQVQVFYVKYKKDDNKGLIIDDPVPALTPLNYKDENEEEENQEQTYVATQPPPVKSTTLRTIIHPDSEKYHSNSGIHVTFNTEDKSQTGHNYQEFIEESALQPVVVSGRSQSSAPLPSYQSNRNFDSGFDHQARISNNFNTPPNFRSYHHTHHALSTGLQLPLQNTPTLPFRNIQERPQFQGATPNRFFGSNQFFEQKSKNVPPFVPLDDHSRPSGNFFRPPPFQQSSTKLRPPTRNHDKPIPIPLHSFQQDQHLQQQSSFNRFPQFSHSSDSPSPPQSNFQVPIHNFQPFNKVQQNIIQEFKSKPSIATPAQDHFVYPNTQLSLPSPQPPVVPFIANPTQSAHYQQTSSKFTQQQQSQPIQQPHQLQQSQQNQQQFQQAYQSGGLIQKNAPNLSGSQNNSPNDHGQEYNQLVPGAELIQSVPKYEQHITQTIPISQINQPFAQPLPPTSSLLNGPRSPQESYQQQQTVQHSQVQSYSDRDHLQSNDPNYSTRIQFGNSHVQTIDSTSTQIVYPMNQKKPSYDQFEYLRSQQQFQGDEQIDKLTSMKPVHASNAAPIKQKIIPGQSVSTLADEVFPLLEGKKFAASSKQNPSTNFKYSVDLAGKNKFSVQQTVSVTQKPSVTDSLVTEKTRTSTAATKEETPKTTKKPKIELPDEVPDDLREQLLSSGILDNADISVLDYDKIGDVPLESLPPEHLANFYGAGGASQISSSNKILSVVKPDGEQLSQKHDDKIVPKVTEHAKDVKSLTKKQNVELKVVRFDSNNQKSVTDKYIRPDSTVLPSVDIGDKQYNRYLPLKLNGAQFPIPDVPELRGRKISSVVVLAPVDGAQGTEGSDETRFERDVVDTKQIKFIAGDSLKQLLKKPTKENFKKWLDKESKTDVDSQSVVLLVMRNEKDDKEIFMYDIPTHTVNKLSGELSSAFVNVAEANAAAQEIDNASLIDSGIMEKMPATNIQRRNDSPDTFDDYFSDSIAEPSNMVEIFSKPPRGADYINKVDISSGYSSIS